MNEVIRKLKEEQVYPCLMFFYSSNPNFGKTYTLDDIPVPTEDTYELYMCDNMTLGKEIPAYGQWSQEYRLSELKRLLKDAECGIVLKKTAVESFDDIGAIKQLDGFLRFITPELDEHFKLANSLQ